MQKNILIIDTETIGLEKPFIYDIGVVVATKTEKGYQPLITNSFIIKQVYDNRLLFQTAYYHNKKPLYTKSMQGRKSYKRYWGHVARYIDKLVDTYNIQTVYAYNSPFDKKAVYTTSKVLKTYQPLKRVAWRDIHAISNELIHRTTAYKDYCKEVNAITPKGYYQTNAERTYQFIKGEPNFIEEHTGLADALIELDILNYCIGLGYQQRKEYRKQFIRA
jgi:hypothetical protein